MTDDERAVLVALVSAASKVPIVAVGDPASVAFMRCKGCDRAGSEDCPEGCWVLQLERAVHDASEILK